MPAKKVATKTKKTTAPVSSPVPDGSENPYALKNRLQIGCWLDEHGEEGPGFTRSNYHGMDIIDFGQNYVWDIAQCPWPVESDTYDHVYMPHLLEHFNGIDVINIMNEVWRVLNKDGTFELVVPHMESPNSVSDPTHKSFWNEKSVEFFLQSDDEHVWVYKSPIYPVKHWQLTGHDIRYEGEFARQRKEEIMWLLRPRKEFDKNPEYKSDAAY